MPGLRGVKRLAWALLMAGSGCAGTGQGGERPRPEPAADLVRRADAARRAGLRDEATALYRQALVRDAGSVRAHAGLQVIGLAEGRDLELRRAYRRLGDGFLSSRLEGRARARRAALRRTREPWRSLGLGAQAAAARDAGAAVAHFRRALRHDPGCGWAHLGLARALLGAGRMGEAEAEFRAAAWNEPGHPVPWLGLSVIADRRGNLAEALRCAEQAFQRAPAEAALGERLANLARRTNRRSRMTHAAERLLGAGGDPIPAETALAAAGLFRRAGEAGRMSSALELARVAGATDREIEAAARGLPSGKLGAFAAALRRGTQARYRHYAATGEAESFEEYFAWVRRLYERTTGRGLGPAAAPLEFSFVGRLVDPTLESGEPLVKELAGKGLLLVAGQRRGGPPEAILADIVRREPRHTVRRRGVEVDCETVWTGARHLSGYTEWAGGGDVAGLALPGMIIVDLDAVARWQGGLERRRARLEARRDAILEAPALADRPVTSLEDPAGVAGRLELLGAPALEEDVRVHEEAHLVDAERHLPVGSHPLRNLGLAIRRGFSPREIEAFLERNAQLAAIAEGPDPRTSLAICCESLGRRGAHARGYREIVEGFVDAIHRAPERFPSIDPGRVIVQQLHRLEPSGIRALARQLMRDWGVGE